MGLFELSFFAGNIEESNVSHLILGKYIVAQFGVTSKSLTTKRLSRKFKLCLTLIVEQIAFDI